MMRRLIKSIASALGVNITRYLDQFNMLSLKLALAENGTGELVERLRRIAPDISEQESSGKEFFNDYYELKRRSLQAFQCNMMLTALAGLPYGNLTVVDIGDSAGTHMLYLRELTEGRFRINSISVNLDPRAIEKVKARGLRALLCRAEDLDLGDERVDLFTSFQMIEHLHNPALFFHRLALRSNCRRMVITAPYLKSSRVGLHHLRQGLQKPIFAEDEHILELSPEDWTWLILHSGWRVTHSEIHYQYPRRFPLMGQFLAWYWRQTDFEGFWGAILEKDTSMCNLYQDWED